MQHLELRPEQPPTPKPTPVLPKLQHILGRTAIVATIAAGALVVLTACLGALYLMVIAAAMNALGGIASPR